MPIILTCSNKLIAMLFIILLSLTGCESNDTTCKTSKLVLAGFSACDEDSTTTYTLSSISKIGSYDSLDDNGGTQYSAYNINNKLLFVSNQIDNTLDAIDISTPSAPSLSYSIDMDDYGTQINAVAIHSDTVAVAIENKVNEQQLTGKVILLDADDGRITGNMNVGYQPIHLAFTSDGAELLVANAGEPSDDYSYDPVGSITHITVSSRYVQALNFADFNAGQPRAAELPSGVRVFGPNASVEQDLEPQHITLSSDDTTAWVSLQENNAIAKIDIPSTTITSITALGTKDFNDSENTIDVSDEDSGYNLNNHEGLLGLYQPDQIASYTVDGTHYVVMTNEGAARDYSGFSEKQRIGDIPIASLNSIFTFKLADDELGRLYHSNQEGKDNTGIYQTLAGFGGRSFSIRNADAGLVFDSTDDFARYSQTVNTYDDTYSDDQGTEPEAIALATIENQVFAFIGLTRGGGFLVYDITDPNDVSYNQFVTNASVDTAIQHFTFIPANDSPNSAHLLIASYETSGTIAIYQITGSTSE